MLMPFRAKNWQKNYSNDLKISRMSYCDYETKKSLQGLPATIR